MKKIFFITILLLVGLCKINALDQQNITCERAWEIVLRDVLKNNTENVNVFVSQSVIFSGSQIKTMYRDEQSPDFDSWFFFIDDKPFASWAHPCRYVYINIKDGTYVIVDKQQPPLIQEMKPLVEKKINVQGELFDFNKLKSLKKLRTSASAIHNYAVIISGGGNAWSNWVRYWNDCSAIYSTLINVYGYPKDHIYVLISDGTNPEHDRHHYDGHYDSSPLDLDGDGSNDIQYAATRANITQVFNTLRNRLTPADNLFIYTTDHGGQESGTDVYMNLWNEIIRDDEFASEINKVNAGKINICMEQCHSGGFIDDLQANNRVIATACRFDESSYAMSNLIYNEFVYHWTAAVAGRTPQGAFVNADSNNDGIVSMREAFLYAQNHDIQDETPQYLSIPAILGQVVSLKAFSISGPSSVCDQATYTVENLPQGATVQWSVSNNNVTLTSGQGTHTATFTKFRNGMEIINADILFNNIRIALLTKETYFGAPSISNIIGEQRVPTGQYASYRAVISNNAPIPSSYQWILNPLNGNSLYGNGTESIDIAFYNPGSYQLVCRATNECGVGDYYTMGIGVYDNLYLTLSPNPATDEVTLQLTETDEVSGLSVLSTDRSAYEIQIWSGMRMLRSFRTNEPTFQISMAGLPAGLYFVRVVKNGQTYTQKLIKK
ncbi:hypothetical protein CLI86_12095 [Tannerella forsythia]|uniref:Uncharacterized protein n=2 Tax=Tannerella forsythia TaxID=28112 RepID=A0A2A6E578_TANFO|nr:C13 family peptidase [Tannerella forsythia]PDP42705.1 hypothetical protein CLI86_12095 [Tannerella forsythia]